MSSLQASVQASIRHHDLIGRGQACLLAVSGGLDSMVLLDVLSRIAPQHGWRLAVAHLNHQLRGASSNADQSLVRRTARKLGLPFFSAEADVKKFARIEGISLEMAGRKLRHQFLAGTASKLGSKRIALAHHADDQLELFFLRLFRGSGPEGLSGMKWRSPSPAAPNIDLVRPLLDQSKAQIEEYASLMKVPFRNDASNESLDFQRNRVRHELLPLLRRKYQPALQKTILRTIELLRADAEFLQGLAAQWLEPGKQPRDPFDQLPLTLQRRVVQLQLLHLGVAPDFELIESLRTRPEERIAFGPTGPPIVRKVDGSLCMARSKESSFNLHELKVQVSAAQKETIFSGVQLRWRRVPHRGAPPAKARTEAFDADRVGGEIILRHWRPGDRFQPIGMENAVKLQDFFTNEKVDRERRRELIIAQTVQGEVFWVEGMRIAERFKLTKGTIRRLNWQWRRL